MDTREILERKIAALHAVLSRISKELAESEASRGTSFFAGLSEAADLVVETLTSGGKVLAAGNGGSAAEAHHFVGEMVGRFRRDKTPLPAIALSADPATFTALSNDYGYETVFARQIDALAKPGDVVLLLSTSGRSPNLLEAAHAARGRGARTIALVGASEAPLSQLCDVVVPVPSEDAQTIQEMHLVAVHALAWAVEERASPSREASTGRAESDSGT